MMTSLSAAVVVRDAVPQDFSPVTNLLTTAFAESPVACWLDPHEGRRPLTALAYIGGLVRRTIAVGIARVAEDGGEIVGATLWSLHSGAGRPVEVEPVKAGTDRALTEVHRRRRQLERLVNDRRPRESTCQQLVCLGVRPDRRRQGIGSCLLMGHHAFLHVKGIPAYFVAPDECWRAWFERLGYSGIGPPQLLPGGGGLPTQAMWRPPESADRR